MQLTYEDAVAELRKAVEARGSDYTYPEEWKDEYGSCQYVRDGQPACIMGQVFHQIGLALEGITSQTTNAGVLAMDLGLKIDVDTEALFRVAQNGQDRGVPWGEAVEMAIRETSPRADR